ncbi:MAG: L-glutamate gamma-semialdehyde dehydrogenase [Eubacteriales bacterium]|nr:L-glutamate gamma-semialdehyde dehydrogenase [Eubacteriales bacterium]MDD4541281.1 L-glutamate gamma-semialdehyde dehydrogenase [Eubacteriales bacterium]
MNNAIFKVPEARNEPILAYEPGSKARESLKLELERQSKETVDIPVIIGREEIFTSDTDTVVMPHQHQHVLATTHLAGEAEMKKAVRTAMESKAAWASMPFEHRAAIFLKAADLLAGPWRDRVNAATMLGQSKTVMQSEIDAACELCDFLRYGVSCAEEIYRQQPKSIPGVWNRQEYRPLDGFVMAISPFNFTSIGGNLAIAPALMGNTVIWKPARTATLSNYYVYQILLEAGLPKGAISFLPSSGKDVEKYVLKDPNLGGFHFTGSTAVFQNVFRVVGENISTYRQYPRLVGETGGKDFVFAHPTADVDTLVPALVRGAFEYQGQKCSAASRAYIPESLWSEVKEKLLLEIKKLKIGDVRDFTNFLSAVIDQKAFTKITAAIEAAKESDDAEVLVGDYDDSVGYYISPTVILAKKADYATMKEELFGPVLTVYVYEDEKLQETLELCDKTSPYALTGAIFAQDRAGIVEMEKALTHAAGNFYINDKPTGAVVGQQPFGGSRASGTNDKAGSVLNLLRWVSPRTIKENLLPSADISYPFMQES